MPSVPQKAEVLPFVYFTLTVVLALAIFGAAEPAAARVGKLVLTVIDESDGKPLPCRMHLTNERNRNRRPPGLPALGNHFEFDGKLELEVPLGNYKFEISCGPEYYARSGHFRINDFADDVQTVTMKRFVNMKLEGWWSGDLGVARSRHDLPLLVRAGDINVAEVITWSNNSSLWARQALPDDPVERLDDDHLLDVMAGHDATAGGGLTYHQLDKPARVTGEHGSGVLAAEYAAEARARGGFVEVDAPYAADMPLWIARGVVDGVRIAGPHLQKEGIVELAPGYRPRDRRNYAGANGLGRYTQEVYYHLLNCGLRIPPTGGTGSGITEIPVGYNRTYVHCGESFEYDQWWQNLRAGRVVVTNGPMLRPLTEGEPPGHIFAAAAGERLKLELTLNLSFADKVEYLEIVKNGEVAHHILLDEFARRNGMLPELEFDESGWFLIRAVADTPNTYRFASSGPWYVQIGEAPRVSKASAQYMLAWVYERAGQINEKDAGQRRQQLAAWAETRDWWLERLKQATVE
ncbi:MAG: hypothetical protein WD030_07420 [Pirellulales bacterium]